MITFYKNRFILIFWGANISNILGRYYISNYTLHVPGKHITPLLHVFFELGKKAIFTHNHKKQQVFNYRLILIVNKLVLYYPLSTRTFTYTTAPLYNIFNEFIIFFYSLFLSYKWQRRVAKRAITMHQNNKILSHKIIIMK